MANVLWLQGGACSGNTMSFLNAEEPTVVELVTDFGINILWHPSIGLEIGHQVTNLLNDIIKGKVQMDILVFEGTIVQGPNGQGTMNYFCERPMKDWVKELCEVAGYVVAIGDCATWGGIPAVPPNPSESTGVQFHKTQKGGFLGTDYVSKGGLPVINIPGCPAHPDWITQNTLLAAVNYALSDDAKTELKSALVAVWMKKMVVPYDQALLSHIKNTLWDVLQVYEKQGRALETALTLVDASYIANISESFAESLGYISRAIDIFRKENAIELLANAQYRKGTLLYPSALKQYLALHTPPQYFSNFSK